MDSKDNNLEKLFASQKDIQYMSIADEVMEKVKQSPGKRSNGILVEITRFFPKVAAACLLVIFALLLKTYIVEGSLDSDALLGISEMTVDEAYTFYE